MAFDILSFVIGQQSAKGSGGTTEGVDAYYQQLAEALMTRNAEYVSGDETTMSLKGFVFSDGNTLGSVAKYAFAGFSSLESIELSDTILFYKNAFADDENLKIIDITVSKALPQTGFLSGSLNGCTALETIIVRPSTGGLDSATVAATHGSNDTFYVYVPSAYYDTITGQLTDTTLSADRYRKLEDYPDIDNWKGV